MTSRSELQGVQSVSTALTVLETVVFAGEELGVTQVAERLRQTKGAIHRHLQTLVNGGYLVQNIRTSRYGIGMKCRLLAGLPNQADRFADAEETIRLLRDRFGHRVVLSACTPTGALVMMKFAGTSTIEIGVRPGSELQFHASAQGKAMLAFLPRVAQQRILQRPRQKLTPHTITDLIALEADLAAIVKKGFAVAPNETVVGLNAIAAPIFDDTDACVASVAMIGSIQFIPEKPATKLVQGLKSCAAEISRQLGYKGKVAARVSDRRSLGRISSTLK
jgi:IclR family KDG regulon transcriptional repressor